MVVVREPLEACGLCPQGEGGQTDDKEIQSVTPRDAKLCNTKYSWRGDREPGQARPL